MQPHEILAEQGNCREVGPNVMYPEPGDERGEAIAKMVCEGCVVIDLCREQRLANNEKHGVWAGMGEREWRTYTRKVNRNESRERRAVRETRQEDLGDFIFSPDL
jgi:WhiB family redox-sensing transcriptional regulator